MYESKIFEKTSAYISENRLKVTLEAEAKLMVVEANETEVHLERSRVDFEPEPPDKIQIEAPSQRLDAIYDDEPLGFKRDPLAPT